MDPDPDPSKEIEVDPDPERGLKWIRIRPNAVDPDPKRCLNGLCDLNNNCIIFLGIRRKSTWNNFGINVYHE